MIDSFISSDLAVAPNPLGLVSSLKLLTIPVDAQTFFELWAPIRDDTLLAEEAMLLRGDRPRLEEIREKLTWLFGATSSGQETVSSQEPDYGWLHLMGLLEQSGTLFDALTIDYLPQAILPDATLNGITTAWTVRPLTWQIHFWKLEPVGRGYRPVQLPTGFSITHGQPITRQLKAEMTGTRPV
ncbi:hypothetical protein [Leptodesmis sp.]|uniref:hypothetical protein n=1 Tax=Leptodesmis sp. TaxID=3100501 RepID=UPI0040534B7D